MDAKRSLTHSRWQALAGSASIAIIALALDPDVARSSGSQTPPEELNMADTNGLDHAAIERSVIKYVGKVKDWPREDYRLEVKGITDDHTLVRVWVIHTDDEKRPVPGEGKSVELHLSVDDYSVIRELAFQ